MAHVKITTSGGGQRYNRVDGVSRADEPTLASDSTASNDAQSHFIPETDETPAVSGIRRKARQLWFSLTLWVLALIFVSLYSACLYRALLSPDPRLGKLLLPASDTNFLVSVLSQVFAELMHILTMNTFDSLRYQFASRRRGTSMPSFFSLSAATQWKSVLFFAIGAGLTSFWGVTRYVAP